MAEQQDDKSRLPLAGVLALAAMISSFLIYEGISLKTSRPIDKEMANTAFLGKGLVQSRLWQDPFEAAETYRLQEEKRPAGPGSSGARTLENLLKGIRESGTRTDLRVMPVFVDGSPYVNGVESRLRERYAMVSALGAAGYVPESGEYIRVFEWSQDNGAGPDTEAGTSSMLIPVELFVPKAKLRDKEYGKPVLVVWLKDQDFGILDKLLDHLNEAFAESQPQIEPVYSILGPRSSATLSAMLKELQAIQSSLLSHPPFSRLKQIKFYSPWATAEDTFLLDYASNPPANPPSPHRTAPEAKKTVDELFNYPRIEFARTIKTDAVLAAQLIQELRRRQVDLKPCPDKGCNPQVALISEWDTLYGRSLPRTFAAVAMNGGSGESGPALASEIDKLRRDEWPRWIYPHSYLAGLDGELPAKEDDKKEGAQPREKTWYGGSSQDAGQEAGQRPVGRGQLDYVIRLAAALKQQEAKSGEEFKAIGVLGSDVYDKLLILQALRNIFPRAIFFTTDLNAGLTYPAQWQSARNLVVASHFGLELQPALQTPIPPFRDNYQTSLFYAALWALEHFIASDKTDCPDCFQLQASPGGAAGGMKFSANAAPRLYEIGRHGAFDISTDTSIRPQSSGHASIHAPRPDLDAYSDTRRNLKWMGVAAVTAIMLVLAAMLISSTVADACLRTASNYRFWLGLAAATVAGYGLVELTMQMMPDVAENEPFALTEGISAWPTAGIRLLAFAASLFFLWYSWRTLKDNEKDLAREFNLEEKSSLPTGKDSLDCESSESSGWPFRAWLGLHYWRPQTAGKIDAVLLWREYTALGKWKNFAMRGLPQVILVLLLAFLLMVLLGSPNTPCRGAACFAINNAILILSVVSMLLLIFHVVDAIRLCRRWVNCIAAREIQWPAGTVTKMIKERGRGIGIGEENSGEWLGIELIADRTTVIGNFIYFPFVIMFLLGIARHTYFDNWDFPAALVVIFIVNAMLIVVSAMALRRSAEMAKREAIKHLEKKLIELPDEPGPPGHAPDETRQRQQIERAIEAIRKNQRGAFLPLTKHPVFGAIALPSGGYGLVLLFEYLATAF